MEEARYSLTLRDGADYGAGLLTVRGDDENEFVARVADLMLVPRFHPFFARLNVEAELGGTVVDESDKRAVPVDHSTEAPRPPVSSKLQAALAKKKAEPAPQDSAR